MTRSEDIAFWQPQQAAALLAAVSRKARAAFVVGLFVGCRTAELARLRWGDVDLAQGHIVVGGNVAKTASRRLAPIPENAREWLRHRGQAPTCPDPGERPRMAPAAPGRARGPAVHWGPDSACACGVRGVPHRRSPPDRERCAAQRHHVLGRADG